MYKITKKAALFVLVAVMFFTSSVVVFAQGQDESQQLVSEMTVTLTHSYVYICASELPEGITPLELTTEEYELFIEGLNFLGEVEANTAYATNSLARVPFPVVHQTIVTTMPVPTLGGVADERTCITLSNSMFVSDDAYLGVAINGAIIVIAAILITFLIVRKRNDKRNDKVN